MKQKSPEEMQEVMKAWMDWNGSLGDKLVSGGSPFKIGANLLPNNEEGDSMKELTGYFLIQAADMDEAKSLLRSHPHLDWHDSARLEVQECMQMGNH